MKNKNGIFTYLCVMALLVLSGCGGGGSGSETKAVKDYVYRYDELPASKEMDKLSNFVMAGDTAYIYGVVYNEEYTVGKLEIARLDDKGEIVDRVVYEQPEGIYYNMLAGNEAGDLFCIKTVYNAPEDPAAPVTPEAPVGVFVDTVDGAVIEDSDSAAGAKEDTDTEEAADTEGSADTGETTDEIVDETINETADEEADDMASDATEEDIAAEEDTAAEEADTLDTSSDSRRRVSVSEVPTEQFFLVQLDMNGGEKWSVCLNDIKEINDQDYFYVGTVSCIAGQKLLVNAMNKNAIFDMAGNYQGLLKPSGPGADQLVDQTIFLTLADGRLLSQRYDDSGVILQEIDPVTGVLGKEHILTGNVYSYNIGPGAGYDVFITDSNDLYGYNLGQEMVKLMNYVDSDLDIYNISNIWGKDSTAFWGVFYDNFEGRNYLAGFTKIPPEEVPDKVGITIAGSYIDWDVKGQIVKFNKSSQEYRIQMLDYGVMYNTPEDYQAGAIRLNADIASGNIPDILMISTDIPAKSYMSKGLFTDLIPFIENDEELSMEDLLPNIVNAYSVDGHLYQLVPQFSIMTVFAKTSEVGSEPGWTIREAQEILAKKPEGTALFTDMTRDTMIYYYMNLGGDQFVDWEKGECYFDTEEFAQLLEFIKDYPEEIDYSQFDQSYWEDSRNFWRSGRVLAQPGTIDSLRWFNRMQEETFGEEVTMIGFPTGSGTGSAITNYLSFAISSKSKHQDIAWEILRYYLSDEYQGKNDYQLPISKKAMERIAEEAMDKAYYMDEQGRRIETDEYYYVNDEEFPLEPLSAEEWEKLKNYIYSIEATVEYNTELENIIKEEAAPYFAGQKSVREVTDIIQSRAQIYISENS